MEEEISRIIGCLAGLAVGDAMGRPTELLFNYRRIEARYGKVTDLIGREAGAVTDDTRLTLTLADAILEKDRIISADELIDFWKWHPEFTWRKFLRSYNRSVGFWIGEHIVAWAGRLGLPGHLTGYLNLSWLVAGNEAAMIMAPVGIICRGCPVDAAQAARDVARAMLTGEGVEAAAAWAAAIATALSKGATVQSVIDTARSNASPQMRSAIERALSASEPYSDVYSVRPALYRCCRRLVTIDARETIPMALAMFWLADGDPMTAVVGGANLGRDSDTIAGMAGLLSGALRGIEAIDKSIYGKVCEVNGFDLEDYAARLATVSA
ncbi:MAG: ADP-ribosylglycohydrolase family protein [Actinobacteria bacterium]|nr:ADP-ribosylglycohydrolase family protein [Actinomycetota bacterium]